MNNNQNHCILHIGLGSFHRAHLAVYQHMLSDPSWRLIGGNARPGMEDNAIALQKQRGAYTLETVSPQGVRKTIHVASLNEVILYEPRLQGLITVGADSTTKIISFTVTEAGYYLDTSHNLILQSPDIVNDLKPRAASVTIYGALTLILQERMKKSGGKITLLCCDNLRHNGTRFRGGFLQFLEALGKPELRTWVESHTTTPNSMVDRITPRPTPELCRRLKDPCGLMSEAFLQWVVEDCFAAGRPAWEKVGVQFVERVDPYEEAKIRILNASHSCIAWAGQLKGYRFIHEGTRDVTIRSMAYRYVTDDVIPCLQRQQPPNFTLDLAAYRDIVLDRFSNDAIADTNQRVAMDGFSKIPGFIVPTIRERLEANESIDAVAVLPALFLAYLQVWYKKELPYPYIDGAMNVDEAKSICSSKDTVAAFCANQTLFGSLASDSRLLRSVRTAYVKCCGAGSNL